jgi:hypothetical protein
MASYIARPRKIPGLAMLGLCWTKWRFWIKFRESLLSRSEFEMGQTPYSMKQRPFWEVNRSKINTQLVKKFPALCGNRRFITAFTRARHLFLSWGRSIQPMPPFHFYKTYFNIIFPSSSRSFKCLLPSGVSTKTQYAPLLFPHTCYMPCPSQFS